MSKYCIKFSLIIKEVVTSDIGCRGHLFHTWRIFTIWGWVREMEKEGGEREVERERGGQRERGRVEYTGSVPCLQRQKGRRRHLSLGWRLIVTISEEASALRVRGSEPPTLYYMY